MNTDATLYNTEDLDSLIFNIKLETFNQSWDDAY